ncbi:MAG: ComEA family DNA-binding protein [Prosthecobacter sp.]
MSEAFPPAQQKPPGGTPRWVILGVVLLLMFVVPALLFFWMSSSQKPVNPNTATREQLMTLPEMAPDIAARILALRPFTDESDFVKRLPEISPKLLDQIRTRLDFDGDGQGDCCVVH